MINKFSFAVAIALVVFAGSSVLAQPATQPKPQAPATQTATINVPVSKVAVIFSAAFQDPKQGIVKFTVLLNKLNGEFQKTQDELTQTAQKIKTSQDEITNLQGKATPPDPKMLQTKLDQLDQMKKDYQRRGEDAQAAYQKRRQEIFTPLQDEVGKALDAYAKSRGITLVMDASQVEGILFASDNIDITRAFISDYNLKNPATAAVTPPKP